MGYTHNIYMHAYININMDDFGVTGLSTGTESGTGTGSNSSSNSESNMESSPNSRSTSYRMNTDVLINDSIVNGSIDMGNGLDGHPSSSGYINDDDQDNDIVITMSGDGVGGLNDGGGDNDHRSIHSYGNDGDADEVVEVKKAKHYKLKRFKSHIDHCKNTKDVVMLKYHDLAFIISVIQISVIVVSTGITFFETLKEEIGISAQQQRVLSISLSTYIALVVSISRFLKFDENKEHFGKLSEKWNQTITSMRNMRASVESLDSYSMSVEQMKAKIHTILAPSYRETMSVLGNYTDNLINMKEKTYYRNILMNMRLDEHILERHSMMFEAYNKLQNDPNVDSSLDKYKTNYTPCLPCGMYVSKYDKFFRDIERIYKETPYRDKVDELHIIKNKYDFV